jgi:hypothetical protein
VERWNEANEGLVSMLFSLSREPPEMTLRIAEYDLDTLGKLAFWHAMRGQPFIGDACGNQLVNELFTTGSSYGLGVELERKFNTLGQAHRMNLLQLNKNPNERYVIVGEWS